MGRHGGGPAGRTRVSWPVVAIGLLVVAAIGFGLWLWSIRSVVDPVDAAPVDAYAVVVSSPGCTSGTGSTVIDLNLTPAVRSSLSACGRRVGERVAVQYLAGHPDQARLAGTAVAHNNSAGRWLPIAILAAGLLAVIGTLSLLIDRHRSRHDGKSAPAGARTTVAQLRAAANDQTRAPAATGVRTGATSEVLAEVNPDTTTRIAAAVLPGAGSTPLRPTDIVEEDLFTHRAQHPG